MREARPRRLLVWPCVSGWLVVVEREEGLKNFNFVGLFDAAVQSLEQHSRERTRFICYMTETGSMPGVVNEDEEARMKEGGLVFFILLLINF